MAALRKWRLERDVAVDTFLEVLGGDRQMAKLKRSDVLALRKHWQDRVVRRVQGRLPAREVHG